MKAQLDAIVAEMESLKVNMGLQIEKGNASAGRRGRKNISNLTKMLKELRAKSNELSQADE